MTRKEAIKWLARIEQRYIINGDEGYDKDRKEALHMAIEILEYLDNIEAYMHYFDVTEEKATKALERKRGIWMPIQRGDKGYSAGDFICSCCGKPNKCYSITDYCCNCGAKMERRKA